MNKIFVTYAKKNLVLRIKNIIKWDHCHYTCKYWGAAHNVCNLRYKTTKEIPLVFHNGSKYDYHFIIRELAEEFKVKFEYLWENTEKYRTFLVPINKELENSKTIT